MADMDVTSGGILGWRDGGSFRNPRCGGDHTAGRSLYSDGQFEAGAHRILGKARHCRLRNAQGGGKICLSNAVLCQICVKVAHDATYTTRVYTRQVYKYLSRICVVATRRATIAL